MGRLGMDPCTVRVNQPRGGQSRRLLHPVRVTVHENPEPELEVDEWPDDVGRHDVLAQPVGVKNPPIETAGGSEDVSHAAGQLTVEPFPYRNGERPLVPALANALREQGSDDL